MKKIYSACLFALFALIGISASAQAVSVTVEVNDPSLVKVEPYYYPATDAAQALVFDADNQAVATFPEDAYAFMNALHVFPITAPDGTLTYVISYKTYDKEGNLITEKKPYFASDPNNSARKTSIAVPADLDGGKVVIEVGPVTNLEMTIEVVGNPSLFKANIDGKPLDLEEGTQTVEFAPGAKFLYIVSNTGAKLYRVLYNGNIVNVSADAGEGGGQITYGYTIFNPQDGDKVIIEPEYPDTSYDVTITCKGGDFIQKVMLDKEEVADWSKLSVKAGTTLSIQGSTYDYEIDLLKVNGFSHSLSTSFQEVVEGPLEIVYYVTPIERTEEFIVYLADDCSGIVNSSYVVCTNEGFNIYAYTSLRPGYNFVKMCDKDLPFTLSYEAANFNENADRYVYLNDKQLSSSSSSYQVRPTDKSVVKCYYLTSAPQMLDVDFVFDGVVPFVKADYVAALEGEKSSVLPGTRVSIYAPSGVEIERVEVNGIDIEAVDGEYVFVVNENTSVKVYGKSTGVEGVCASAQADNRVYNMQGVQVSASGISSSLPSGIYLMGGKKIRVK